MLGGVSPFFGSSGPVEMKLHALALPCEAVRRLFDNLVLELYELCTALASSLLFFSFTLDSMPFLIVFL